PTGWGGRFDCRSTALGAKGRAGNSGAAGGHSHPGRVLLQRISVCLAHSVGAPPSVRLDMLATPPPPAGIRTPGGCSYGRGEWAGRYRTLSSSMSKIRVLCGGMLPAARPP